jgi:hypothetical protein
METLAIVVRGRAGGPCRGHAALPLWGRGRSRPQARATPLAPPPKAHANATTPPQPPPQVSRNYTLLSDMDAEDAPAPLLYTDLAEGSHFFSSLPPSVVRLGAPARARRRLAAALVGGRGFRVFGQPSA